MSKGGGKRAKWGGGKTPKTLCEGERLGCVALKKKPKKKKKKIQNANVLHKKNHEKEKGDENKKHESPKEEELKKEKTN